MLLLNDYTDDDDEDVVDRYNNDTDANIDDFYDYDCSGMMMMLKTV